MTPKEIATKIAEMFGKESDGFPFAQERCIDLVQGALIEYAAQEKEALQENYLMNRISTANNPYQGKAKKVLCVCAGGCLRSPTAAVVLSQAPYNYNTRAAGLEVDFAIIPVDQVLLHWADEIVCMDANQQIRLKEMTTKPVYNLSIPDRFEYGDPELVRLIRERYKEYEEK